jgi:hypothetical protein
VIKASHAIWALLGIILILICILVFRKPNTVVEEFDETPYLEIIESEKLKAIYWENQAEYFSSVADSALVISDSLQNLKPEIKHVYHEIYKFNSTATTIQLDSVIRANL